jgi:hypothetical protein
MNYLKFILLLIIATSCETLIDDLPLSRFPELKSKLVLTSFISPQDSLISVRISQSTPLFGEYSSVKIEQFVNTNGDTIRYTNYINENIIKTADVTISNGNKTALLKFDIKTNEYIITAKSFPIEAGKTYTIKAKTSEMSAEASTTVPFDQVKIGEVKIDSTVQKLTYYESTGGGKPERKEKETTAYALEFSWADVQKVSNFYKVEASLKFYNEIPFFENGKVIYKQSEGYYYTNWGDRDYSPQKRYISDQNLDGKIIFSPKGKMVNYQFSGEFYFDGVNYPIKNSNRKRNIIIKLFNVNQDYYQNQLSLEKLGYGGESPFSEPIQVYTNVKNGLGCFGAFNKSEMKIPLK